MKAIKHVVVVGVVDFGAVQIKVGYPSPVNVENDSVVSKAVLDLL
jgi:hypothetical protein